MNDNRFQDFFEEDQYVLLKNHLYNYRLRKRAVEAILAEGSQDLILETGSGISPVMTRTDRIVYSELSPLACQTLKRIHGKGWYVVADATRLPFAPAMFSHAICSEVLEHIEEDRAAVAELARVLKPGGDLLVTFPHRRCYFANDDRFVRHHRRYERADMEALLEDNGLRPLVVRKVLGPLEKITMMAVCRVAEIAERRRKGQAPGRPLGLPRFLGPLFKWGNRLYACLAWLDARIAPQSLAAVLLIKARKGPLDTAWLTRNRIE
jgi:SAM-dependent methyltransferase